ncbi:MAG: branched-chain amino acid ABC transporter permease [Dehalococcoidia bacterium]|nr:branched-chain amino acid ABC transporter permease [Dehalococcoidia bacterium]
MLPGGVFSTKYDSDLAIIRTKTQWLLLGIGLALLFTAPLFASSYWLSWLTRLGITVVAVLGLHVLSGLCGQISIGHAAFMGVGAYTVAILTARAGLSSWLCLPICGLSAGLVGLVFGLPCFRLKGLYLAISTLAANSIIIYCIQHVPSLTGGFMGLSLDPLKLGPADLSSRAAFYVVTMVIMVLATIFAKNIQRTATGRAFIAIRDNELAAEVSGIPVFRCKMLAFFIGCVFAGVAGWLWAYSQLRVNPNQFGLYDSMWYVGMLIVGGWGSTSGVFFGAIFLRLVGVAVDQASPHLADALPSLAQQIYVSLGLILSGLIVVLFMLLEPKGLYSLCEKFKAYYRLHPYAYWGSRA